MSLKSTPVQFTKAIEILGAECFGALNMVNALGGVQTPEWEILRNNTWKEIVQEAIAMGIDFKTLKCAVSGSPLHWSATIRYALGEISDQERRKIFYRDVKNSTDAKWTDPALEPPKSTSFPVLKQGEEGVYLGNKIVSLGGGDYEIDICGRKIKSTRSELVEAYNLEVSSQ